jgi:GNAT superfamily N-acetyltransferase
LRALAGAPDAYGSTLESESAFGEETWRQRSGDSHALFGVLEGRVVAIAAGIPDRHEAESREIVGMWVEPDARGRGIAASLVEALVDWATGEQAVAIALWVSDGNETARRVYERCGFIATGQRDLIRPGLSEERMRRPLR